MATSDYNGSQIAATGNDMKSYDDGNTFLDVSGGSGNRFPREVHIMMTSTDGEFCQGWFRSEDLLAAITHAAEFEQARQSRDTENG